MTTVNLKTKEKNRKHGQRCLKTYNDYIKY